jgi:PAS domain S-box-containing protein
MARDLQHAVSVSSLGLAGIVGVTLCALGAVLLTATTERRISVHLTGRELAEEKLRDTEDRMRFALDAAGVGTWEMDLTTGRGEWSPQLQALHGVAGSAFPRGIDGFLEHVHPDDRAMVNAEIAQAIGHRRDWSVVYRTVWPDGSVHVVNEIGRAFYDDDGTPTRTAGVGIDVTERQRLEMHLRQAQKMEAIGKLAGGVAHDFNNLLTAIVGFGEMARAHLDVREPARADIDQVLNAARSAGSLTRQLMAFSRMQMLQPQVLDLNTIVTRLEAMLRRTIGDDVKLLTRLDPHVGHVNADPGQIEQVVMNLVVNGRDAMAHGGTITIETGNVSLDRAYVATHPGSSAGPQVMIAISDTGSGMTDAVKARLFEPFFTTKEQGRGTGLGLATVYGIVKQSGGFIWVDTEVGRGTTFRVYLPRTERALDALDAPVPMAQGGTETILLVEDQDQVRATAHAILTRNGYVVLSASSGDAALRLAEQHPGVIDLLLTDVIMPGMNGPDLARVLVGRQPDLRVLFTSGYIDRAVVRESVIEPGHRFIQKPFSPDSLLREVRLTLDVPRSPSYAASAAKE